MRNNIIDFDQNERSVIDRLFKYYPIRDYHLVAFINNQLFLANPSKMNDNYDTSSALIDSFPWFSSTINWSAPLKSSLEKHGICSFIESVDVKNIRMWSLYADAFNGFAIEFDPNALKNYLNKVGFTPIHLLPVTYLDQPLNLDNKTQQIKISDEIFTIGDIAKDTQKYGERIFQCIHLAKDIRTWGTENEWRLIVGERIPSGCTERPGGYSITLEDNAYLNLYIGYKVPQDHQDALYRIAKSKGINSFIVKPRIIDCRWDMDIIPFSE